MTRLLITKVNGMGGFKSPLGIGQAAINYPDEFEELYQQMQAIVEKRRQVNSGQLEMFPANGAGAGIAKEL